MSDVENNKPSNFIRNLIEKDAKAGKHNGQLVTRFPPEPNGYLHIGHAKSICLNFGLAEDYNGQCNLRFDDTNPEKESQHYIDAIKSDVTWLGYEWAGDIRYASNYFDELYGYAVQLIKSGDAYVCELNAEQMREYRGTLKEPGKNSPYRERPIEENLAEFEAMRAGNYADGEKVLRAKIDMASPNINMRDPIIYRIRHIEHHQTGDKWCIYPMYDFTHPLSDAMEGITHSLCTLEFADHRPLYNWAVSTVAGIEAEPKLPTVPEQTEFARLELNYTITSKRKLKQLVDDEVVTGWDDPRMPTIAGYRRRGYTPTSIRNFCESIGVAKAGSTVDLSMLESAIRDDLNSNAKRAMCVLDPIKLVITNYPEDKTEIMTVPNHMQNEALGKREISFSNVLYIEREDFAIEPPKKWKRLSPEFAVRLRGAYVVTCTGYETDEAGNITEVHATFDENTLGKNPEGYKPKGVIHWVSADTAVPCEVRLYDRLFTAENPAADENLLGSLNPESLVTLTDSMAEASLANANTEEGFQFERQGYFCRDRDAGADGKPVFNRTVGLRDSWAKRK